MDYNKNIKLNAVCDLAKNNFYLPEEGETISFKGGLGNKVRWQIKKENEIYYERKNELDEWKESNILERIANSLTKLFDEPKRQENLLDKIKRFFKF